jgi:phthalate 4,5-cis-dihydrodiol dehydrogenase
MGDRRVLGLGFIGIGQAVSRMFSARDEFGSVPFRIAGAADLREHARERFSREFDCSTFATAEELCRSKDVDVVYVATPHDLHCKHAILAARHGKHVIVEKPMALTIADCDAMIEAADAAGVKLLAGHTHSFDAPIQKMWETICSGTIGDVVSINTWNFNEFNHRPWPTIEIAPTHGPVLRQGPHQVDIVRQLGGGMVRTVRAQTIFDPARGLEGGWQGFLEFENGMAATFCYDARGFFDTAELFWWIGEGGTNRPADTNAMMRRNLREISSHGPEDRERILESQKEQGRYGATFVDPQLQNKLRGYHTPEKATHQPFFGLTVVNCERGAMRQSPDGLLVYDDEGVREVPVDRSAGGRVAELNDLYAGIVDGRPIFHDGRWGRATLEVCLAILESARTRREIDMHLQVPMPREISAGV